VCNRPANIRGVIQSVGLLKTVSLERLTIFRFYLLLKKLKPQAFLDAHGFIIRGINVRIPAGILPFYRTV
jgi:hypothetical protein